MQRMLWQIGDHIVCFVNNEIYAAKSIYKQYFQNIAETEKGLVELRLKADVANGSEKHELKAKIKKAEESAEAVKTAPKAWSSLCLLLKQVWHSYKTVHIMVEKCKIFPQHFLSYPISVGNAALGHCPLISQKAGRKRLVKVGRSPFISTLIIRFLPAICLGSTKGYVPVKVHTLTVSYTVWQQP